MCGIFGYTGNKPTPEIIHQGLRRLEYRGYDSWGISILHNGEIYTEKEIGMLPEQPPLTNIKNSIGIGHTRWATHGGVTKGNAHPHKSDKYNFVIAQNGIVENYSTLKNSLKEKGYIFKTEVDTEVILHLIEEHLDNELDIKNSLICAFKQLEGRNTVIVLDSESSQILAIRNGSPLVLGVGDNELFLASDPLAFNNHTSRTVDINNHELIQLINNKYVITDINTEKEIERKIVDNKALKTDIDKGNYDHYMLKEIEQQKETILSATEYTKKELQPLINKINKCKHVYTIGAGTAGYAADQIAYYLRKIASIPSTSIKAYELESYLPLITSRDVLIAISQSGETADTIEAIEYIKYKGAYISSIINMPGSTISRISDITFMSNAGPEVCVASTKVFTSQVSFGYLLSKSIIGEYTDAKNNILELSNNLSKYFNKDVYMNIENICNRIYSNNHFFILGKGQNFHIAQEGALKIKEISYKHFEGFAAGELKHGVIALIEKDTPVISIISNDGNQKDMISSTQEVKARGAYTIGIGDIKYSKEECFNEYIYVANTKELKSISNVIPFQLISYFLAKKLGNNIDKPRNLAKSVTVK